MKRLPTAVLILFLSVGLLTACDSASTNHALVDSTTPANVTNRTTNRTDSVIPSWNTTAMESRSSEAGQPSSRTGNQLKKDSHSSHTNSSTKGLTTGGASTSKGKTSKANATSTNSKSHNGVHGITSTAPSLTSSTASAQHSTSSGSSHALTTSTRPSGMDTTWTDRLNSPYADQNYTGPNRSLFDGLVEQVAEGKVTPGAAKASILDLPPWNAVWTTANNGDGKTYSYHVNDVGVFAFQTKVLSDDVIAREWQAHGQAVLDDSFYSRWAVTWDTSTEGYTVAFLDVGFQLYSNPAS